jgi:PilZ domain
LASVELPARVIEAQVLDVTEHGLSLRASEPLTPWRGVTVHFLLPGTAQVVSATADFIWADGDGRAGLRFSKIPAACRLDLVAWLERHRARKSQATRSFVESQHGRIAASAD